MLRSVLAAVGLANKNPLATSPAPAGEQSASALVADSVSGWHVVTLDGYSNVKAVTGNGKFVRTRPFTVGGHRWYLKYFPNGEGPDKTDYITFYLMRELDGDAAGSLDEDAAGADDVSARFRISLLDHSDQDAESRPWQGSHKSEVNTWKANGSSAWRFRTSIHRSLVECSAYLRDNIIKIRCDVMVCKEIRAEERDDSVAGLTIDVPPPDVGLDILQLLWDGEGSDVTFEVAGETFRAHRCILAARSPVFTAELFGPMKETTETCVRIHDMEPRVFKMLLDFVYTDWVPEMDEGVVVVISQHLLVAADRYGIQRLKLICEHNLCCRIDVSNVATSLVLAEQHGCQGLKKGCIQFLKSGSNLKAAMSTDGFEHLTSTFPNVIEELLAMVAP